MKKDINYYKRALEYLQNKKMAFCYGQDGEFITIGSCYQNIGWKYNELIGWYNPEIVKIG